MTQRKKSKKTVNNTITDAEKNEFRDAVKGVHTIKPSDTIAPTPPQTKSHYPSPQEDEDIETSITPLSQHYLQNMPETDWIEAEDCLHFARSGLQHNIVRKLRQGQFKLEGKIDLHNCTADEAMTAVQRFISACQSNNKRWVCIIHGKGLYSKKSKPILKNVLNQWFRTHPQVLAFHSAKQQDGGTGSLYVLLKIRNVKS